MGAAKAKTKKSVVLQQIFIQTALSQKQKVGEGKSIHFLNALLKTYSNLMFGGCCCQGNKNMQHQLRYSFKKLLRLKMLA